jgi:hypothetical protein
MNARSTAKKPLQNCQKKKNPRPWKIRRKFFGSMHLRIALFVSEKAFMWEHLQNPKKSSF